MHHKRKKPRNARAGCKLCKLCKPWKVNGHATERKDGEKFADHRRRAAARRDVRDALTDVRAMVAALLAFVCLTGIERASAEPVPPVPEIEQAIANKAKMATRPKWISGPPGEIPEAERALGHHGEVVLEGVLTSEGKLTHLSVKQSSGAPTLDDYAKSVAADQKFEPARDADGAALPIKMLFPLKLYNQYSSKLGGGGVLYTCSQFALDMNWWRVTFPYAKWSDHEFYTMMLGIGVLARMDSFKTAKNLTSSVDDFEERWVAAIATCGKNPDKMFVDVLQPEGTFAKNMAKNIREGRK